MRNAAGTTRRALAGLPSRALGFRHSFLIAIAIALASFMGVFTPVDGRLYDTLVAHAPNVVGKPRQVLLIDANANAFLDPTFDWNRQVNELLELGARLVVLTVIPEGDVQRAKTLLENPKVILGADLAPDPETSDRSLFNMPPGLSGLEPGAVFRTPDPLLGVHRYQRFSYPVGIRSYPSVEALAAQRLGLELPAEGRFLVNFGGADKPFPRISLNQILQGNLIKEVVKDRVALIGLGTDRFHRAVVTPITSDRHEVSELEFHGYALDTLLSGSAITSLPAWLKAALVILGWMTFFFIAQPMSFRSAVMAATVMVIAVVGMAWLALLVLQVHVPVLSTILVIGTTLVSVAQAKAQHHDGSLERLVNTARIAQESRLKRHEIPQGEEFWPYAIGMVDQSVPITRAVLFERVPGTARLRKVQTLRCGEDAWLDVKFDVTQEPYASAARSPEGVAEVQGLLKPIPGEQHQFLAPLISDGELVGCLAFGTGGDAQHRATVLRAVGALCKRLSEMVRHNQRRAAQEAASVGPPFLRKYLSDRRNEATLRLSDHLRLATHHSDFLEGVLNRLRTPTMVYDLFGRPLFANTGMKSVLREASLSPDASSSAAQLIERACGLSSEESRLSLTSLTIDGHPLERPAWVGTQRYALQADTLGDTTLAETTYDEMMSEAHGLMFQLLPAEVGDSTRPGTSHTALRHDADAVHETDVWPQIEAAGARIAADAEFDGVTVRLIGARQPAVVRTRPRQISDLLSAVLQLLAYDSKRPGHIAIEVTRKDQHITVCLSNQGFGMPDDRLQAMLYGPIWPQSASLRRIRQLRESAPELQTHFTVTSTVSVGYRASLTLPLII